MVYLKLNSPNKFSENISSETPFGEPSNCKNWLHSNLIAEQNSFSEITDIYFEKNSIFEPQKKILEKFHFNWRLREFSGQKCGFFCGKCGFSGQKCGFSGQKCGLSGQIVDFWPKNSRSHHFEKFELSRITDPQKYSTENNENCKKSEILFLWELSLRRTNSRKVNQGSAVILSNDPSLCFQDKHKMKSLLTVWKQVLMEVNFFYIYQGQIIWRTWPYASQRIETFVKNRKFRQHGNFKYLTSIW